MRLATVLRTALTIVGVILGMMIAVAVLNAAHGA